MNSKGNHDEKLKKVLKSLPKSPYFSKKKKLVNLTKNEEKAEGLVGTEDFKDSLFLGGKRRRRKSRRRRKTNKRKSRFKKRKTKRRKRRKTKRKRK